MNKETLTVNILQKLSKKMGKGLSLKVGKDRLSTIAEEIADYKDQMGWSNTDNEIRRLEQTIRFLEPRIMMSLKTDSVRLSKKSEVEMGLALRAILTNTFPFLQHIN